MSDQERIEQWQQWRQERAAGLASEHGWLSVVGRDWIEDGAQPRPISGFPGLWTAVGKTVVARFDAADDVARDGEPCVGEVSFDLNAGDDQSLTHGTVRAEVLSRGTKVGVRYRDSAAATRREFTGVPCFDYDPAWRVPVRFTAQSPQRVSLQTVDPEVEEEADIVGLVDFELDGEHYSLPVLGEPGKPFLNFYDETNGEQTADWRFVTVQLDVDHSGDAAHAESAGSDEADADDDAAAAPTETPSTRPAEPNGAQAGCIDFNYAMNFPFAFLPGGCTCPKPLPEAKLAVAVTAGEQRP